MSYKKIYTEVVKKNVGFDKKADLVRLYTYECGCCNKVYLGIKQSKNVITLDEGNDDIKYYELSFYPIKNCLNTAPIPKVNEDGMIVPVRVDTNFFYYDGLIGGRGGKKSIKYEFLVDGFFPEGWFLNSLDNILIGQNKFIAGTEPKDLIGVSNQGIVVAYNSSSFDIIGPAQISTKYIKCPPLSKGQSAKIFLNQ